MAALLLTETDHEKPEDGANRNLTGFKRGKQRALHPGQKSPIHEHRLARAG